MLKFQPPMMIKSSISCNSDISMKRKWIFPITIICGGEVNGITIDGNHFVDNVNTSNNAEAHDIFLLENEEIVSVTFQNPGFK